MGAACIYYTKKHHQKSDVNYRSLIMQLVPVVEIHHGKCVTHAVDSPKNGKLITQDILSVIDQWAEKGVDRIHLLDIDAIKVGEPQNISIVRKIKQQHPHIAIQVMGGINSVESAYIWRDGGADYFVLNSKAMRRRDLLDDICFDFPNAVLVEIDSLSGNVGMGSGEPTLKLAAIAKQLEDDGVSGLVVTEVSRDLQTKGNSLLDIGELCKTVGIPIYVNVGVRKTNDLKQLLELQMQQPFSILLRSSAYDNLHMQSASNLLNKPQVN